MTKNEKISRYKLIGIISIAVIILVQAIYMGYVFKVDKTSWHEDELFTYELSNSYYKPFIYGDKIVEPQINFELTGEQIKNNLNTTKDTAFSYGSVYDNQVQDLHPPLYYFVLHTICSFTPGHISKWYGYAINVICMAVSAIFLYKWAIKISKSNMCSIAVCALGTLCIGAFNTYSFVRMYGMLTMFTIITCYLHTRIYNSEKLSIKKDCVPLGVVAFLGALTNHIYLPFCFFLAAFYCLHWLRKKNFKNLLKYAVAMLSGTLLSIAVFPATIAHLFGGSYNEGASFEYIRLFVRIMISEITGYMMSYYKASTYPLFIAFLVLVVLILAVSFLCRKDKWFKKVVMKIKVSTKKTLKEGNFSLIWQVVSAVVSLYIISYTVNYFSYGFQNNHYMFHLYPVFICAGICLLYFILRRIIFTKHKKISGTVVCLLSAACIIFSNVVQEPYYIYKQNLEGEPINVVTEGADCIVALKSTIYLPAYTQMLQNVNQAYFTSYISDLYNDTENDTSADQYKKFKESDNDVYLIVDNLYLVNDLDEEQLAATKEYYEQMYEDDSEDLLSEKLTISSFLKYYEDYFDADVEFVSKESSHGVELSVYKLNRK